NNVGLYKYDGKSTSHFTVEGSLSSNNISKIIEDKSGNLWISTWDSGVNRYDGRSFIHFGVEHGLSSESVPAVLKDKSGNIWLATNTGICKYDGKLFNHIQSSQGLGKESIGTIRADKSGNIWVGTFSGGVNKFDGKSIAQFTTEQGLSSSDVIAIMEDRSGNMWFATYGSGVNKYDGRSFTHYSTANGLIDNHVFCILEDRKGNFWFGTPKGLSKFDGKSFTNYLAAQGLISENIYSILEDHNGSLWFGTGDKGVCTYDGVSFTHYNMAHSLSNASVLGIMEDKNKNIWFCTSHGVNKFDGKYFTHYTTEQGLSNNIVKNILEDKSGNIWIGTINGMNRLIPQAPGPHTSKKEGGVLFKKYTRSEGFLGVGTYENAITQDKEGNIWIGATDRITMYHPQGDIPDTIPPTIQLSGISLFNENINWHDLEKKKDTILVLSNGTRFSNFNFSGLTPWYNQPENLQLAYNNNYITFQFIGITTNRPKEVKYKYFLEGLDENWSTLTDRPEAAYNNLPHGKYTFKVKAVNSEGYYSNELKYPFTIFPPWWKTWWAYVVYGLIMVAGISVIFYYRSRSLRRELEQRKKEQQFAELQQQKTELEMQALRAQMNPHFIFNSLNSINGFILKKDTRQASDYLTKFSKLVRLILQNSQAALIPLESELESLQLYLELEAVRFDHHFEYKINVDEDIDDAILKIPPLIIQPYAENAIWHGLMHKEEKGYLEIEIYQQADNVLCCKITDNGVGRKKASELKSKSASTHKSMGMRITADRIAILQQKKQLDTTIKITDLVLPDGSAGGTEVLLKIPVNI
ncbi:MAG: histidine kinase, partial [Chitinophagaceae bacterium]|nr:histidine kinase [Chitinophagaceae bacterium]